MKPIQKTHELTIFKYVLSCVKEISQQLASQKWQNISIVKNMYLCSLVCQNSLVIHLLVRLCRYEALNCEQNILRIKISATIVAHSRNLPRFFQNMVQNVNHRCRRSF